MLGLLLSKLRFISKVYYFLYGSQHICGCHLCILHFYSLVNYRVKANFS